MLSSELVGKQIRGFGTEIEIDDYTGAFSGYLALTGADEGQFISVEFLETETDFGPDGTSFEPEMTLSYVDDPGGEFWELDGVITSVQDVVETITAFDNGNEVWRWERTAGLILGLGENTDKDTTLSFHCASPRAPEVVMRLNKPLPPVDTHVYQQHQTRKYSYERTVATQQ
ncbi:hypothetical protein ACXZ66_01125 [Corynebacterium sp. S7]